MREVMTDYIKCSICGRFIAFADFIDGKATAQGVFNTGSFSEEMEYTCGRCNEKEKADGTQDR